MKLFSFLILLAAFLQTSLIPLNLCLILLISRAYTNHSKQNYFLAFFAGIFLGFLAPYNIGFWPLTFLVAVFIVHVFRLLPISGRFLTIIPVAFIILTAVSLLESLAFHTPFLWLYPVISSLLTLPIFIVVHQWEDRFIIKPAVKLKM